MSLYLIIYLILLGCVLLCFLCKKEYEVLFVISLIILTAFLCLRYGQGTDYFSYRYLYYQAPDNFATVKEFLNDTTHTEPGWKLLETVFRTWGASFELFSGILALIEMLLIGRFIWRCCPAKSLALLMIYPAVYMTYVFSAMRQGLILCIFLGLLFPLLKNKRYLPYLVISALCITLHSSAVMFLVVPLILMIPVKAWKWITIISAAVGGFFSTKLGNQLLAVIAKTFGGASYLDEMGINYFALAERILMFAFIGLLYLLFRKKQADPVVDLAMKIYLFGFCVFIAICWLPLIASRLTASIKAIEILLISVLFFRLPRCRLIVFCVALALTMIMTIKNIDAYLKQGQYAENLRIVSYPYVSVFNKQDIFDYRDVPDNLLMEGEK